MPYRLRLPPEPGSPAQEFSLGDSPSPQEVVIPVMTGDDAGFAGPSSPPTVSPTPSSPAPAAPAADRPADSWLYDVTGAPISLADFYHVRQFKVRGCPTTFWYARNEMVMARLLEQGIAPGLVWLEDELLQTLLHPDLTAAWLQQIVAVRLGLDDGVWPVSAPRPTIAWPKPRITSGRSRAARPPREPGDESESESEERA
jgi:hypothetical protein